MKINTPNSVANFIESFIKIEKGKKVFYYIPYWFEKTSNNSFILHNLESLPESLIRLIGNKRSNSKK